MYMCVCVYVHVCACVPVVQQYRHTQLCEGGGGDGGLHHVQVMQRRAVFVLDHQSLQNPRVLP